MQDSSLPQVPPKPEVLPPYDTLVDYLDLGVDAAEQSMTALNVPRMSGEWNEGINEAKEAAKITAYKEMYDWIQHHRPGEDRYAELRANQFSKGIRPITFDEFQKDKRGVFAREVDDLIAMGWLALEGNITSAIRGKVRFDQDRNAAINMGLSMFGGPSSAGFRDQSLTNSNNAEVMASMAGDMVPRVMRAAINLLPGRDIEEFVGKNPQQPMTIGERIGEGSGTGKIIGEAGGSLAMSLPGTFVKHPGLRAGLMAPFFFSGYDSAVQENQRLLEEQTGMNPAQQAAAGYGLQTTVSAAASGAVEFGSEYAFAGLQRATLGLGGTKAGKAVAATSVGRGAGTIKQTTARLIEALYRENNATMPWMVKGAIKLVLVGAEEGVEELIPAGAKPFLIDLPILGDVNVSEMWDDMYHAGFTGAVAGLLLGGGVGVTKQTLRVAENRRLKGMQGEVTAAAAGAVQQAANDAAVMRLRTNQQTSRGVAMATHRLERVGSGDADFLAVSAEDVSGTITPDVKKLMNDLSIGSTPVKVLTPTDGSSPINIYATAANAQAVAANFAADPRFNAAVAGPQQLEATGIIVTRDASGQIVDLRPYSTPDDGADALAAQTVRAKNLGYSVDDVDYQNMPALSDDLSRQMGMDKELAGRKKPVEPAPPAKVADRGVFALRADVSRDASGTKNRGKAADPFNSSYLTADEIGNATNADVKVDVKLRRVPKSELSEAEANLGSRTGNVPIVLDGKAVFTIKNHDGTKRTIEKPISMDGAYVGQSSRDGIFLIRENGTAFNGQSAIAIAIHEMRHRTLARSRAGAQYFMKLMQLDPVFAMRGGIQYARSFDGSIRGLSDADAITQYVGMYNAAVATVGDPQSTPEELSRASENLVKFNRFAQESVTTTANKTLGETAARAAEYAAVADKASMRTHDRFVGWVANALVKNGFMGVEAEQALYEIRQRLEGVKEENLQILPKIRTKVETATAEAIKAHNDAVGIVGAPAAQQAAPPAVQPAVPPTAPPSVMPSLRTPGAHRARAGVLPPEEGEDLVEVANASTSLKGGLAAQLMGSAFGQVATATETNKPGRVIPEEFRQESEAAAQELEDGSTTPETVKDLQRVTSTQRRVLEALANEYESTPDKVLASLRPITRKDMTPEMQDWSEGSVVVDEEDSLIPVYHGTSAEFDEFKSEDEEGYPLIPYRGGLLTFASTDPDFAGGYAGGTSGRVIPLVLNIQNPFDFRDRTDLDVALNAFEGYTGRGETIDLDERFEGSWDNFVTAAQNGSWDAIEQEDFVEFLRERGHDGVIMQEGNAINYGVFNPNQLKGYFNRKPTSSPKFMASMREEWTEEGQQAFTALAAAQRDEPEKAMLNLQRVGDIGLLNGVSEHLGDITHRMTDKASGGAKIMAQFGLMDSLPKVKRVLHELRSGYGYAKDVDEETAKMAKERGVSETELRGAIDAAMQRYATAHAKLPVYNRPQELARDAAVAFGNKDFSGAATMLEELQGMMSNEQAWENESTRFDKNYKGAKFSQRKTPANAQRRVGKKAPTNDTTDIAGPLQRAAMRKGARFQTAAEEIKYSVRQRAGRRPANEDVRRLREEYLAANNLVPPTETKDQYVEISTSFSREIADWFESSTVNTDDPAMLEAYAALGAETKKQYLFLQEAGYSLIPWGGEGQPYPSSKEALNDIAKNKRLFYFKSVNEGESAFGSQGVTDAIKANPLLADAGIPINDSEGKPYTQTFNDLFRAVHDVFGHSAEGYQFGQRGEENAYRSHYGMFTPLARGAMATETRGQNSWVNFGPLRRGANGVVFGEDDPRYAPWLEQLKNGVGYADQKPMVMPVKLQVMYSQRTANNLAYTISSIVSAAPSSTAFVTYKSGLRNPAKIAAALADAQDRVAARGEAILNSDEFQTRLGMLLGERVTIPPVTKQEGIYGVVPETSFRIDLQALSHARAAKIAELIGSVFMQEAVMTLSAPRSTAAGEPINYAQHVIHVFTDPTGKKLNKKQRTAMLLKVGAEFGGGSATSDKTGVWTAVPIKDHAKAITFAKTNGFESFHGFTELSFTNANEYKVLGRTTVPVSAGIDSPLANASNDDVNLWVLLAEQYAIAIQAEGFEIDFNAWSAFAGFDAITGARVARELRRAVASRSSSSDHGINEKYLTNYDGPLPKTPGMVAATTTPLNVEAQLVAADQALANSPDAFKTLEATQRFLADLFGSRTIPNIGRFLIKSLENKSRGMRERVNDVFATRPQVIYSAIHGLQIAQRIAALYNSGHAKPRDTVATIMWAFMSRGVNTMVQESMWFDLINTSLPVNKPGVPASVNAFYFFDLAIRDEWTPEANKLWMEFIEALPVSTGSAATHNANAFGEDFLSKIGAQVTVYGVEGTVIQHLHDAYANAMMQTKDVRRVFHHFGGGLGIDNKIVSFSALALGKPDGSIMDRVRIQDQSNADRSLGDNAYDGHSLRYDLVYKQPVFDDAGNHARNKKGKLEYTDNVILASGSMSEEPAVRGRRFLRVQQVLEAANKASGVRGGEFNVVMPKGRGLASAFENLRGAVIYEAAERQIDPNEVFADVVIKDPTIKPFVSGMLEHWVNWNAASGQEANHASLEAVHRMIQTQNEGTAGTFTREGQYDYYAYGSEYGYIQTPTGREQRYIYRIGGNDFFFTPPAHGAFVAELRKEFAKKGFGVSTNPDGSARSAPWFNDPRLTNAVGRISAIATKHQDQPDFTKNAIMFSVRAGASPDEMVNVTRKQLDRTSLSEPEKDRVLRHVFALRNPEANWVALTTPQGIIDASAMFTQPEPMTDGYARFNKDNKLVGINPGNVWWHASPNAFTEFDARGTRTESAMANFGTHMGGLNQAKDLLNHDGSDHLYPLYVTARSPVRVDDLGVWYPHRILRALKQAGTLSDSRFNNHIKELSGIAGLEASQMATGWQTQSSPFWLSAEKRMAMNAFTRSVLDDLGIDALTYINNVEGLSLGKALEGITALDATAQGTTLKEALLEARLKNIAVLVWNPAQIKAVAGNNGEYSQANPDIRKSVRVITGDEQWHRHEYTGQFWDNNQELLANHTPMYSQRAGTRGALDETFHQAVDKYNEVRRYTEQAARAAGGRLADNSNPYLGARNLVGVLGAFQLRAEQRYLDLMYGMTQNNIGTANMDEFLTAQHAHERNAYVRSLVNGMPDGGSGMTDSDATTILNRHRAAGTFAVHDAYASQWRDMLAEGLLARVRGGLITQETYNHLTGFYSHYVPLRGAPVLAFDENFDESGEAFGRGMSTTGRGMPVAAGRRSTALGTTSQVGYLYEDTMRRVARNEVGQRFLRLVQLTNDPGMAVVERPLTTTAVNGARVTMFDPTWASDPRNFGVYVNEDVTINGHDYVPGDLVVVRINNRRLQEGMNSPSVELRDFEIALRHVNNAWRTMTTGVLNPVFAPKNLWRDLVGGTLNNIGERGYIDTVGMLIRWTPSFMRIMRDEWFGRAPTGRYAEFVNAGGDMVAWAPNDLVSKRTDFAALEQRVLRRDPNDRSIAQTALGWYPAFFKAAETATRLAQYQQRIASGASPEQAALAARDITVDFAKGGMKKGVANTWYMFLNAGIQGTVNTGRGLRGAKHLAPALVGLGVVNALMCRVLAGYDDEEEISNWDKIPSYEKASNFFIFDPSGSGKYIKVPLPYGYNAVFSAGVRIADAAAGDDTVGDAVAKMFDDSLNAFNPLGGSGITGGKGSAILTPVPTMLKPWFEVMLNEDWSGRRIQPQQFGKFLKPDSSNFYEGTPSVYTGTSDALNAATGGDGFEEGGVSISPNTLQHMVGFYLSGAGRLVNKTMQTLSGEGTIADVPFAGSFVGDASTDDRALTTRYMELATPAMAERERVEARADPEYTPEERAALMARPVDMDKLRTSAGVKDAETLLRRISQAMRNTDDQAMRDQLMAMRREVMKAPLKANNLRKRAEELLQP